MRNYFANIDDYKTTMSSLIQQEYNLIVKLKAENNLKNIELNFQYYYDGHSKGHDIRVWGVTMPVPAKLLAPEDLELNSPAYVNPGDSIKISWDPKFIPTDFKEPIDHIEGKIEHVKFGKLTAIFKLKTGVWPPDAVKPDAPRNTKPPRRIVYNIDFLPNDAIFKRRMKSLKKLNQLSPIIQRALIGELPGAPNQRNTKEQFESIKNLNPSQERAARAASSNDFTIIQGPPGCGKTHTIGAIAVACLKRNKNKKIMICGTTNVSINSLLEISGNIITDAGFKVCWPAARSRDLDSELYLTDQQKFMTFYQIMHLGTPESDKFYEYQKRVWENEFIDPREIVRMNELREKLERQVIMNSDVIFSTLDSSVKKVMESGDPKNPGSALDIDSLIVDEATLSVEASMIIPFYHTPRRLILVGDQKQLGPPPTFSELTETGFYTSFFERIINMGYQHTFLLNEQYRMHPDISQFPNEAFYNGFLIDRVAPTDRVINKDFGLQNHVNFINVSGVQEQIGFSYYNQDEIQVVLNLVIALIKIGVPREQIGVVAAYGAQAAKLSREFQQRRERIKVSTIDSFQGSERDYIIITTSRTTKSNLGFLNDERRMNVSITRARIFLAVVGNGEALHGNYYWGDFVDNCKEHNWYIENGKSLTLGKLIQTKKSGPLIIERSIKEKTSEFVDEEPGYNLTSVTSPISNAPVKVLWPNREEDVEYAKAWAAKRVKILNNNQFVTLSYDAESVCLQFGDVFDYDFDYYDWQNGVPIPPIKTNETIIISLYSQDGNNTPNNALVKALSPLLSHPNLTLLTFDFTADLDKLDDFIKVRTQRIIDSQLIKLSPYEDDDLIKATDCISLSLLIMNATEEPINEDLLLRAKERIRGNSKNFPHEENQFLIKIKGYPEICKYTNTFLEYSADDVFLTALAAVDVLCKDTLVNVINNSKQKLLQYHQYSSTFQHCSDIRQAYFLFNHYTEVKQSYFYSNMATSNLINLYRQMNNFVKLTEKGIPTINQNILNVSPTAIDEIRKRLEHLEEILKTNEHMSYIKSIAMLSKPPDYQQLNEDLKALDDLL